MLRGTIDPKEQPTYEYVKFIGNFKCLNNGKWFQRCYEWDAWAASQMNSLGTVVHNLMIN